ncbi:LCP family glycopolymer transferase [Brevibacillus parabrevis]
MKETTRQERIARTARQKWARILLAGGIACLVGLGGYATYVYFSIKQTVNSMYVPLRTEKTKASSLPVPTVRQQERAVAQAQPAQPAVQPEKAEVHEPVTLLLLGIDERENDKGRSDVILVLTVNPQTKSALLVSIPRDTRTQLAHSKTLDKINHAYAFGGLQQAVDTIEQFISAPVDYVVAANMEGFAGIIDTLGGVDVENKLAFTYADYQFPLGPIHLDGKQALVYARMRYEDPRGDLGRNERQQLLIKALMQKKGALASPSTLNGVLDTMGKYVKTNMTFDDMKMLVQSYGTAVSSVETIRMEGNGQLINGIYYYIVSQEEREKLIRRLSAFREQVAEKDAEKAGEAKPLPNQASDSMEGRRGEQNE